MIAWDLRSALLIAFWRVRRDVWLRRLDIPYPGYRPAAYTWETYG